MEFNFNTLCEIATDVILEEGSHPVSVIILSTAGVTVMSVPFESYDIDFESREMMRTAGMLIRNQVHDRQDALIGVGIVAQTRLEDGSNADPLVTIAYRQLDCVNTELQSYYKLEFDSHVDLVEAMTPIEVQVIQKRLIEAILDGFNSEERVPGGTQHIMLHGTDINSSNNLHEGWKEFVASVNNIHENELGEFIEQSLENIMGGIEFVNMAAPLLMQFVKAALLKEGLDPSKVTNEYMSQLCDLLPDVQDDDHD